MVEFYQSEFEGPDEATATQEFLHTMEELGGEPNRIQEFAFTPESGEDATDTSDD